MRYEIKPVVIHTVGRDLLILSLRTLPDNTGSPIGDYYMTYVPCASFESVRVSRPEQYRLPLPFNTWLTHTFVIPLTDKHRGYDMAVGHDRNNFEAILGVNMNQTEQCADVISKIL